MVCDFSSEGQIWFEKILRTGGWQAEFLPFVVSIVNLNIALHYQSLSVFIIEVVKAVVSRKFNSQSQRSSTRAGGSLLRSREGCSVLSEISWKA